MWENALAQPAPVSSAEARFRIRVACFGPTHIRHTDAFSSLGRQRGTLTKKIAHFIIFYGYMQIAACDAYVRVPRRVSNLRQRPTAGQRVADERVPAVVNS